MGDLQDNSGTVVENFFKSITTNQGTINLINLEMKFQSYQGAKIFYNYIYVDQYKIQSEKGETEPEKKSENEEPEPELNRQEKYGNKLKEFIEAIVYVGKGNEDRKYKHMEETLKYEEEVGKKEREITRLKNELSKRTQALNSSHYSDEAIEEWKNQMKKLETKIKDLESVLAKYRDGNPKERTISEIWHREEGHGSIVLLTVFRNQSEDQARAREYCMINVHKPIGNKMAGTELDKKWTDDQLWTTNDTLNYGVHLLSQAHQVYVNGPSRVLYKPYQNGPQWVREKFTRSLYTKTKAPQGRPNKKKRKRR